MTVSTTSSRIVHYGNAATRDFPYGFRIPAATDVYIVLTSPDGGLTTLTAAQYTISGLGVDGGGTVTYPADSGAPALPTGWTLTIERVLALSQPLDLTAQGAYSADAIEGALDRVTMQIQQVADGTGNGAGATLTGPVTWNEVQDKPATFPPAPHTHPNANGTTAGFMSAADKTKLDGLGAAPVTSVNGRTGTVVLGASDVSAIALAARGAALGVASLDAAGLVPTAQLPSVSYSIYEVASQAAMLALSAVKGDWAIRTDTTTTYVLSATPASTQANWKALPGGGGVSSVNGHTGSVTLRAKEVTGLASIKTDYGAACDGSTDDTSAWNAAIADINAGTISALLVPGQSKITAALTTITKGFGWIGDGTRKTGLLITGGGDVTYINVALTSYQEKVLIRDLSILTTLANSGQALKIAYSPSNPFSAYSTVHLSNVEFAGQTNNGSQGWNRGYELVNVSNAAFDHVSFYGYYNAGESQPAGWLHSAWGCKVTATTGCASYALYWRACEIYYALRAHYSPSGNLQGLCWTDCTYAFANTGWELTPDGDTLVPYFSWVNCQWEGYVAGIKADNVSYINITGSQFYCRATSNITRQVVYVSNSYSVTITSCEFNTEDGGVGALGTTDIVTLYNVNTAKTRDNNLRGAKGKSLWFTGNSQLCHSVDDRFLYPAASGTLYKNDSSLAFSNSRRSPRIDGATSAQGLQSDTSNFPSAASFNTAAITPCSINFPVEVGERLRISLNGYVTLNGANETQVTARVREYTHRPGSGSPYQVVRNVYDRNNWAKTEHLAATKPEAFFTEQFEFDVIAAASDARIDLDLWTLSGLASLGSAQMKVERV